VQTDLLAMVASWIALVASLMVSISFLLHIFYWFLVGRLPLVAKVFIE
jgi:hypothetical protein